MCVASAGPRPAGDAAGGTPVFPMSAAITEEVRSFLLQYVDSVEQLEVLLLVRSQPGRVWSADEVAAELRTDPRSVHLRIDDLRDGGLVAGEAGGGIRYAPRTPAMARAVEATDRAYQTHRVAIITLIFSRPTERIRSFADAFRLRKGEDDG